MRRIPIAASPLLLALLTGACAKQAPMVSAECVTPDAQLARLLASYRALPASVCDESCEQVRQGIELLGLACPAHVPTMEANAVVAFEAGRPMVAQQLLDIVLAQPGSHASAAVLRARIAIDEGNLPFAAQLVTDQIRLSPAHADLHEVAGSVAYFQRRFEASEASLRTAERLGAPGWRVAYHLGLIREAQERKDEAMAFYSRALEGNPDWAPARDRLAALKASR